MAELTKPAMTASTATSSAAMTNEEKKKIMDTIKKIFELLTLKRLRDALGSRGNIIMQKLEQRIEELTEAVEQNEISKETLEDLTAVVKNLDGKLDTITAENYEKVVEEFNRDIERILKDIDERYVEVEGKFIDKMRDALLLKAKKHPELISDEAMAIIQSTDFEKDFTEHTNVIRSDELGKNQLLVEYRGISFVTEASFKETEGEKTKLLVTVKDGIDTNNILEKKGVYLLQTVNPYNAQTELFSAFCEDNNYHYSPDRSKGLNNIERQSAKRKFLREHLNVKERNGVESVIFEDSFFVRNPNTSDTLRVSTEGDKITVTYFPNATSVTATEGKHRQIALIERNEGKGLNFSLAMSEKDADAEQIIKLLLCSEMQQYLETSGIPKASLENALTFNDDFVGEISDNKGTNKVKALYKDMRALNIEDTNKYSLQSRIQTDSPSYIRLMNNEDKSIISFSFDKNGVPNAINYKSGTKGARFERVYDIKADKNTMNYTKHSLLHGESFSEMFDVMNKAMTELGIERGTHIEETRKVEKGRKDVKER